MLMEEKMKKATHIIVALVLIIVGMIIVIKGVLTPDTITLPLMALGVILVIIGALVGAWYLDDIVLYDNRGYDSDNEHDKEDRL
jgi:prepilin signal peptidase PulO-like enzyme (type II secretory pathway)